jgi:hypothetical protein
MKRTVAKRGMRKSGSIIISRNFQLIFVLIVVSSLFISNIGFVVGVMSSDSTVSSTAWLLQSAQMVFPALLLAIGYVFANYATVLQQWFGATLRALIGLSIFGLLSTLQNQISTAFFVASPQSMPPLWLASVWSQAILMAAALVIYVLGQLLWMRKAVRG